MRFFFLLFTLPLWAQQQVLSSKGTPVEYVNIGIVGTSKGLITNEQGEFTLERLEAAPTDSIYFSHLSYKRKVLLAKDIQKKIILEETDIKLPEASFTLQKPKYYTLRGKGLPIVFKLYGEMKDGFEPTSNRKYLNAEVGDFLSLKHDARLTELSIDIDRSDFYMAVLRVVVYQTDREHKAFTPLLREPIYIEVFPSPQPQTFTRKLSVFAPKGEVWIGVQFVEMRGKDYDRLMFPATVNTCYIRFADGKIRPLNKHLGIPFSIKGYDYIMVNDQ
ncbi:carboxypeptidase-like regulatory domain-containing protein [Capnocytophaga gingivalis]|jgi:hypothetical protein|uniref:carboxypeptidase-like regulatory domain-containing protein n=1 Tax=Capnocytophaga gingivalis TaxID=1017 RepID=UPI0023561C90|nr:carboxypeptidase-like regulatory domain-containing protein [Capnocytophaga gingivalis]